MQRQQVSQPTYRGKVSARAVEVQHQGVVVHTGHVPSNVDVKGCQGPGRHKLHRRVALQHPTQKPDRKTDSNATAGKKTQDTVGQSKKANNKGKDEGPMRKRREEERERGREGERERQGGGEGG